MENNIKRVHIRLKQHDYDTIRARAEFAGMTVTEIITAKLSKLVHDLQTDRCSDYVRARITKEYRGRSSQQQYQALRHVQLKLSTLITDYLRMNCYNITSCILICFDDHDNKD